MKIDIQMVELPNKQRIVNFIVTNESDPMSLSFMVEPEGAEKIADALKRVVAQCGKIAVVPAAAMPPKGGPHLA